MMDNEIFLANSCEAIAGVPASNLFGNSAYVVFSKVTVLIMSPPP